MGKCDEYKPLLMGLIDGELTPEETIKINEHLNRCAECRAEYEELHETSSKIHSVSFLEPDETILESLWNPPYSHLSRISGLAMVIGGWIALILYILYEAIIRGSGSLFPRIGAAVMVIGFIVLLANAIRERWIKYKLDPYKEIIR